MATKPKTSRRNRKFGPSLDGDNSIDRIHASKQEEAPELNDRGQLSPCSDDQSISEELCELKKWGILPQDFPSRDGDIAGTGDPTDNITDELDQLLKIGAVTANDVADLSASQKQLEECENEIPEICLDKKREIPEFDESGWPKNWSEYDSCTDVYTLVELHQGNPEFDSIEKEFSDVHITVQKIERLQNKRILDRFKAEAEDINRHRSGDFCLNITYLYHGSNVRKETLCEEGLDQRLSRMGYFGRGIYFSDTPLKCVHYSEDIKQAGPYEAYILKCRVILGDIKVYPKGASNIDLKREPEKDIPSHGSKYYDSVLGCPKDFNEYVVYENRRAMIEYIITFQADDDIIKNLRQLSKTLPKTTNALEDEMPIAASTPVVFRDQSSESSNFQNEDDHFSQISDIRDEEDHFSRISDVREAVRKKRLGSSYIPPSREQKKKDKEIWKKLQKLQSAPCQSLGEKSEVNTSLFQHKPATGPVSEKDHVDQDIIVYTRPRPRSPVIHTRPRSPVILWDNDDREVTDWTHYEEGSDDNKWELFSQTDQNKRGQYINRLNDDFSTFSNDRSVMWLGSTNQSVVCLDSINNQSTMSDYDQSTLGEENPVEQVLSVCVAEFLSVTGLEDSGLAKHYVQKAEMDINHAISMYYEDLL